MSNEPACQVSKSKVILFKSYCPYTHTHIPTDWSTRPNKIVGKITKRTQNWPVLSVWLLKSSVWRYPVPIQWFGYARFNALVSWFSRGHPSGSVLGIACCHCCVTLVAFVVYSLQHSDLSQFFLPLHDFLIRRIKIIKKYQCWKFDSPVVVVIWLVGFSHCMITYFVTSKTA